MAPPRFFLPGLALCGLFSYGLTRADYSYHPYYQRQQAQPIISITLDPQESLNTDLRIAAREGKTQQMIRLLKEGAKVDGVSEEGESALMYASRVCNIRSGRLLLSEHAKINLRDGDGKTALIYAAMSSCSPMVSLLVRRPGINIRVRDKSGQAAVDYAREGASLYAPVASLRLIETALRKYPAHTKHVAVNEKAIVEKKTSL